MPKGREWILVAVLAIAAVVLLAWPARKNEKLSRADALTDQCEAQRETAMLLLQAFHENQQRLVEYREAILPQLKDNPKLYDELDRRVQKHKHFIDTLSRLWDELTEVTFNIQEARSERDSALLNEIETQLNAIEKDLKSLRDGLQPRGPEEPQKKSGSEIF